MNILFVGNVASIGPTLSSELKSRGHRADTVCFEPNFLKYKCEYDLSSLHPSKLSIAGHKKFIALKKVATNYEILHFNSYSSIYHYFDFPYWRAIGKKIVLEYHGPDIRNKKEPYFSRFAHLKIVSTPDLLKYTEKAEWLPTGTRNLEFVGVRPKGDKEKIVILNSVASLEHGYVHKGIEAIYKAMDLLEMKYENVKCIKLVGVNNDRAIEEYKKADIIIDQAVIGFYGVFAQECMLLGKPVLCYLNKSELPNAENIPIVQIEKNNPDSIVKECSNLIENFELRQKYSIASHKYVKELHDIGPVCSLLLEKYKTLMK
jgi:glycosyltransferase involved in cell wall biosynthesis